VNRALILLLLTGPVAYAAQPPPLPVAGWIERARLSPGEIVLEAKLDSGAFTSSLHAVNPKRFQRDGEDWIGFDVTGTDGRTVRLERPVVRIARIRSAPDTLEMRPTVTLGICIGNIYRVTEVNLVDRSGLSKPLLIGRRFLRGGLLIDMDRSYTLEPACAQKMAP
jgi:hypothetical protein